APEVNVRGGQHLCRLAEGDPVGSRWHRQSPAAPLRVSLRSPLPVEPDPAEPDRVEPDPLAAAPSPEPDESPDFSPDRLLDSRSVDSWPLDSWLPDPPPDPSPPSPDPAFAAAFVDVPLLRSFFAQPLPRTTIAGAAKTFRSACEWQFGHSRGLSALKAWTTSSRWPQASQT